MRKKLIIAAGLALGLPALNVNAEFTGYYAIENPGPGGRVSIPVGSTGPIYQGNWNVWSESRSLVEFQRWPSDGPTLADGFTLSVRVGGPPANVGSFEIVQPPPFFPMPERYSFRYSFGGPVSGNEAWYIDGDGVVKPLVGEGTATFKAPVGVDGYSWGFYVRAGGSKTPWLVIRDWQPSAAPAPIALTAPSWQTNGSFQFQLSGEPGSTYVTYASTDLKSWSPMTSTTLPAGGTATVVDSSATNSVRRFYTAKPQ